MLRSRRLRLMRPDGQDRRDALYLLLGPVLGMPWFAVVATLYVSGFAAQLAPVGILLFGVAQLLLRPIGALERLFVRALLGREIPAPPPLEFRRGGWLALPWRRTLAAVRDGHSWRVLAWILIRFVAAPVGAAVVAALVVSPLLLLTPLVVVAGWPAWLAAGPLVLLVAWPGLLGLLRALARGHRSLAGWALGPDRPGVEAVALARAMRAEEQVRIDQELHDSIGHMLSMIVVQAGAGAHVFDRDPDFARRALETIGERGRAALGELDRIVATIRTGGDPAPLPSLDELPALLAGVREAGVRVSDRVRVGPVPAAVGRGAFRIVQEALTNAARHAPGAEVLVEVASDDRAVALSVMNPIRPGEPRTGRTGSGLASIAARASLLGGRATSGQTGDGRFAVRAVLPVAAGLPDEPPAACRLTAPCSCLGCDVRRRALG